jgi:hypothetical protein
MGGVGAGRPDNVMPELFSPEGKCQQLFLQVLGRDDYYYQPLAYIDNKIFYCGLNFQGERSITNITMGSKNNGISMT